MEAALGLDSLEDDAAALQHEPSGGEGDIDEEDVEVELAPLQDNQHALADWFEGAAENDDEDEGGESGGAAGGVAAEDEDGEGEDDDRPVAVAPTTRKRPVPQAFPNSL